MTMTDTGTRAAYDPCPSEWARASYVEVLRESGTRIVELFLAVAMLAVAIGLIVMTHRDAYHLSAGIDGTALGVLLAAAAIYRLYAIGLTRRIRARRVRSTMAVALGSLTVFLAALAVQEDLLIASLLLGVMVLAESWVYVRLQAQ